MYSVASVGEIEGAIQLACILTEAGNIYIGRSGHRALAHKVPVDGRDVVGGGWIFIKQRKLTHNCGSYGDAPRSVRNSIENFLRCEFRIID